MKRLRKPLAWLSASLLGSALADSAEPPKKPLRTARIADEWSIAKGTYEGKPIITRFNMALKPYLGDRDYPDQLGIAVPLKHPTENGLPTTAEILELNAIEDQISSRFTARNESVFAGVITTNNMREFVLYTADAKAAIAKAERLREDTRTHVIQFQIHIDPNWDNFRELAPVK